MIRMKSALGPHKCPICGQYEFPEEGSFDICEVCGWEDDLYINDEGKEDSGANCCSPRVARVLWSHGRTVDDFHNGNYTKDDLDGRDLDEDHFDFAD